MVQAQDRSRKERVGVIPNEREIIDLFVKTMGQPSPPYSKIGDDVAHLPAQKGRLVIKSDMLVRKTDAPKQMQLWQIARKSVVACVSDFAAKGVRPQAALISLGLPQGTTSKEVRELARGFRKTKKDFSIEFLGGDTNEADDLIIDCILLGFAENVIGRDGAKPGDAVMVSGFFGYAGAGLKLLLEDLKVDTRFRARAVSTVLMPKPKLELGITLSRSHLPSSAIDSSDGLALSLYEIADQSGVGIELTKLPTTDEVIEFAGRNDLKVEDLVLNAGEEYEIVCTIPRDRLNEAYSAARQNASKLIEIGRVIKGRRRVVMHQHGRDTEVERKGWVHLSASS